MHNIIDTPSSRVRSVAAGPAELVGQVRPGPQGTMSVKVGGSASRKVEGVVNYRWKEEEHVCTKDSDGNESCSWQTRRTDSGGQNSYFTMELVEYLLTLILGTKSRWEADYIVGRVVVGDGLFGY